MQSHVILAVLSLCWLTSLAPNARGLKVVTSSTTLPTPRWEHSAVYDGHDSIYIVGGIDDNLNYIDTVLKYSISSDTVQTIGTFINATSGSAIITADRDTIVYFGGYDGQVGLSSIKSFTISTGMSTVVAHFPHLLVSHPIAWDPARQLAYVFGGEDRVDAISRRDEIFAYNARQHTVGIRGVLPEPMARGSAVWDTEVGVAYIFGSASGNFSQKILQYEPDNGYFVLDATLPAPAAGSVAVFDSTKKVAYIIGGGALVKFDTTRNEVETLEPEGWPDYPVGIAAVYVKKLERIYLFGGLGDTKDKIMYMDVGGGGAAPDCSDGLTRIIPIPHPTCCESFLFCHGGNATRVECPEPQQFNPETLQCEDPSVVRCGNKYD